MRLKLHFILNIHIHSLDAITRIPPANAIIHMIYRQTAKDVQDLIQVDHISATNLSFNISGNSDTQLNSYGYGTVNDEILPSNLVSELFRIVLTDIAKLTK